MMKPKKKTRPSRKEKEPRWQREHREEGVKKRFRLIKTWLLIFFFLTLVGFSLKAWLGYCHRVWDGESRLNIAIASEKTYLLSLDPVASEIFLVEIPSQTQVEVAFGHGFYPLNSVYKLSQLEKEEGRLLAVTLENNFAVSVKAWAYLPKGISSQEPKAFLNQIIYSALKGKARTNLTFWDFLQLLLANYRIPIYQAGFYELSQLDLLTKTELPDKTQAFTIDKDRLDSFCQNHFPERKIRLENLTIEVINSTPLSGLAERGARLLTNIGFEVVGTSNQEEEINQCIISGDSSLKEFYSTRRIEAIFGCRWQTSQEEKRADLVLILGREFQRQF
jgi:hypothetical protein